MDALAVNLTNETHVDPVLEYRVMQPIWNLFLKYEVYTSSPLFPIINSVLFYFITVLPWMICDLYGKNWWIQKYKIQAEKEVTGAQVWKAVMLTFWNHVMYILPLSVAQWVYQPNAVLPPLAPTVWELIWQPFAAIAIFDIEYFIWHSTHHKVRWLYRHVHSVHHQYSSPSSWVTQYLHPWELISVGVFSTTSPWIIGCHPLTEVWFQMFAILASVEAHIGYDMPFAMHKWFPFWAGCPHHDMHHEKPLTNFSPFYTYWDRIFGSYCPGKSAGGVKTKALLDWEKSEKEKRFAARQARLESKDTIKEKVC